MLQAPSSLSATDKLSRLPPAIIEHVFSFAPDLTKLICKSLHLVGTEPNLYRHATLRTFEHLESFARSIDARSARGSFVLELTVNFGSSNIQCMTDSDPEDSDSDKIGRAHV